jgi:phosphatidyl-myo-inositol dimannoside synthase
VAAQVPPLSLTMGQIVVMVTSSYPRFPGDSVGTFMEPIAKSIAARGHDVHVVAPWHPLIRREEQEEGVRFHFYRYAPVGSLNVFGYAAAMRADVSLRAAAYAAAPLALVAGWRRARRVARVARATVMHGHWAVPGGFTAAMAAPHLPLVVSLHGSDVFVAETVGLARRAALLAFNRAGAITACSADLAQRAVRLGAAPERVEVVPYGVDLDRFRPSPEAKAAARTAVGVSADVPFVFAAGRLVRKKGFEYLIDAIARARSRPFVALAGAGDLDEALRARVGAAGLTQRVRFLGNLPQHEVAGYLAAADIVAVPSVHDERGNVDGLPNIVLEALAAAAAVVATPAGGIASVVEHERTGLIVPERDPAALAAAIDRLAANPALREELGRSARRRMAAQYGWASVAASFEAAYARALAVKSAGS